MYRCFQHALFTHIYKDVGQNVTVSDWIMTKDEEKHKLQHQFSTARSKKQLKINQSFCYLCFRETPPEKQLTAEIFLSLSFFFFVSFFYLTVRDNATVSTMCSTPFKLHFSIIFIPLQRLFGNAEERLWCPPEKLISEPGQGEKNWKKVPREVMQ